MTGQPHAHTSDLTTNVVADGFGLLRYRGIDGPDTAVVHAGGLLSLGSTGVVDGRCPDWTALLSDDWDRHVDTILAAVRGAPSRRNLIELEPQQVLPPLVRPQILQAAANYRKHVIDLMVASPRPEHRHLDESGRRGVATELMDRRAESGTPSVFAGMVSSLSGPFDPVVIPLITEQCDWELELGVVIGRTTRYVTREAAMDHVAAYTIANDVTMRDHLYPSGDSSRGGDWVACKGAPTFLPLGPLVVPARFVPDPTTLTITLRLNGEVMQDEAVADMIFDLPRLLEHTSRYVELQPGDLLLTGSPAGNGVHHGRFLRSGDLMTGSITGLGVQATPVGDEKPRG